MHFILSSMIDAYFITLIALICAALEDTGQCNQGDFILKMQDARYISNCTQIQINLEKDLELCFKAACDLKSNVITYNKITGQYSCSIHSCKSNDEGTDWDYGWKLDVAKRHTTYALPHTSTPRCRNSYFVERTGYTGYSIKVPAICSNDTYKDVDNDRICITLACDKNANVVHYFRSKRTCKILHCSLNYKIWERNFHHHAKKLREQNKVATYILTSGVSSPTTLKPPWPNQTITIKTAMNVRDTAHDSESTNETIAIITKAVNINENNHEITTVSEEQIEQNLDYKTLATIITVTAGSCIGLALVIVIILRFSMRKRTVRYTSGSSSGHSDYLQMQPLSVPPTRQVTSSAYISPYATYNRNI